MHQQNQVCSILVLSLIRVDIADFVVYLYLETGMTKPFNERTQQINSLQNVKALAESKYGMEP